MDSGEQRKRNLIWRNSREFSSIIINLHTRAHTQVNENEHTTNGLIKPKLVKHNEKKIEIVQNAKREECGHVGRLN